MFFKTNHLPSILMANSSCLHLPQSLNSKLSVKCVLNYEEIVSVKSHDSSINFQMLFQKLNRTYLPFAFNKFSIQGISFRSTDGRKFYLGNALIKYSMVDNYHFLSRRRLAKLFKCFMSLSDNAFFIRTKRALTVKMNILMSFNNLKFSGCDLNSCQYNDLMLRKSVDVSTAQSDCATLRDYKRGYSAVDHACTTAGNNVILPSQPSSLNGTQGSRMGSVILKDQIDPGIGKSSNIHPKPKISKVVKSQEKNNEKLKSIGELKLRATKDNNFNQSRIKIGDESINVKVLNEPCLQLDPKLSSKSQVINSNNDMNVKNCERSTTKPEELFDEEPSDGEELF